MSKQKNGAAKRMKKIKTTDVLQYSAMPGIAPRLKNLFGSGFHHVCFLFAQIYIMMRLLPANHPYGNPKNMGKFGLRHVIAEAANNLVLSRKNIDKIIIFAVLLIGVALIGMQILLLVMALVTPIAQAAPPAFGFVNFFDTPKADTDLAYFLMARIFGIPNFYCSPITAVCTPYDAVLQPVAPATIVNVPFLAGMHELFRFYSFGLLLVGILIFLYFVVVVVAETAVSGTPFGQRFQNVWVPIRLVMAIGLLVPINFGLNSAQYITLYVAKLGSSMATNGWNVYLNAIDAHSLFSGGSNAGYNPIGERETLIGMPKTQSISEVIEFMSIVHTCAYSYWMLDGKDTNGNILPFVSPGASTYYGTAVAANADLNYQLNLDKSPQGAPGAGTPPVIADAAHGSKIRMYFAKTDPASGGQIYQVVHSGTTHIHALDFYNDRNIHVIFGEPNAAYSDKGTVKPFCGEMVIPVSDVRDKGNGSTNGGSDLILQTYFELVRNLWHDRTGIAAPLKEAAIRFAEGAAETDTRAERACSANAGSAKAYLPNGAGICDTKLPGVDWITHLKTGAPIQTNVDAQILLAWSLYAQNGSNIEIESDMVDLGWAGAGTWFNRIAELNGNFMTAVLNIPQVKLYPLVMEETRQQKIQEDAKVTAVNLFNPKISGDYTVVYTDTTHGDTKAKILHQVYATWNGDLATDSVEKTLIFNTFIDAMSMILGIEGVFDIRGDNAPTHPLTQLTMVGKGLVESTIRNLAVSAMSSFMGGVAASAQNATGAGILSGISSMFSGTAFIGLTAGVVLFYIIPFMPFIYFFFAVGTWLKTIFEAMVGVPLWALAHLRLDGEGLPGDAASNGYFLLFEIFIRPILILFGLIASFIIFTAQVRVLHFIWDAVIQNAGGYTVDPEIAGVTPAELNSRTEFKGGIVDQFFFTVIYAIVVYMLATASFKLIDNIPNNILRWMSGSVTTFGETNNETPEALSRHVATTGMVHGQTLAGEATSAAQGIGQAGGRFMGLGGRAGAKTQ